MIGSIVTPCLLSMGQEAVTLEHDNEKSIII